MRDQEHPQRGRLALRPLLFVLGGYHLAVGVAMAAAPRDFFDKIASFPPYNDHFLRDVASFYAALGIVTLIAAARRSWQVPILGFTVIQYALHIVNHVIDVGDTVEGWHGAANVAALAVLAALVWWLYRLAQARED